MAEYIERKDLKERFKKRLEWLKKDVHDEYSGALLDGCESDMELIDEIPAADVAPVVRCKDCKHLTICNNKHLYAICEKTGYGFKPFDTDTREHFCAYGERRGGC